MSDRRTALITGASSGIGAAFARQLGSQGYDLVITARRTDRLEELASELKAKHGVEVVSLPMDLVEPGAIGRLIEAMEERSIVIDYLVNNAGYALDQGFFDAPYQRHHDFLEVMLGSVVELSHALVPGMVERGWGRVVNVSSLAGFLSLTPESLYGPTKAFVLAFSRSLRGTVQEHGVHVTALCPGYTRTEFFQNIGVEDKVFSMPRFMLLDVDHVVTAADRAVARGKPTCVPGLFYKFIVASSRFLPASVYSKSKYRRVLPKSR